MLNSLVKKEFFRLLLNTTSIYLITRYYFLNLFFETINYLDFIKSLSSDISRFLNINISTNQVDDLFLLFFCILISLFVTSSYWYSNPLFYKESFLEQYFKLGTYTTLFTIFVLYFLRVFNISRFYLVIYLIIIPISFLIFRSNGPFSKYIVKDSIISSYVLITDNNNLGYGTFINSSNFFNKKEAVISINLSEINRDLNETLLDFQKTYSFDSILFDFGKLDNNYSKIVNSTISLKKLIYISSVDESYDPKLFKFGLKKLNNLNFNIFQLNNQVQYGIQLIFKRLIDIFLSILAIFFLIPVFLFISLYIFLTDLQLPIVKLKRTGKHGREFLMYKFRTMYPDAHSQREIIRDKNIRKGPLFKIESDPRIIPRLNWIRNFSLDEIPQFFNVIKGDMSLVGPRPLFAEDLKEFTNEQTLRMTVLPGMTGLLQINARESEDFSVWFSFDKKYIDSWSLLLDLKILFLTPFKLSRSL